MKREYPEHPLVAASALVIRDNFVLLVRRAYEPASGKWSLPGGLIELGELASEAARREVLEECGIEIEITDFLEPIDSIIYDCKNWIKFHYIILVFRGKYKAGILCNSSENLDTRWVLKDKLTELELTKSATRILGKYGLLWAGGIKNDYPGSKSNHQT